MKLFVTLGFLILAGCGSDCQTDSAVDTLATKDGCSLYVYHNRCSREVYFTNCSGSTHTTHTEFNGKISETYNDDVSGGGK